MGVLNVKRAVVQASGAPQKASKSIFVDVFFGGRFRRTFFKTTACFFYHCSCFLDVAQKARPAQKHVFCLCICWRTVHAGMVMHHVLNKLSVSDPKSSKIEAFGGIVQVLYLGRAPKS